MRPVEDTDRDYRAFVRDGYNSCADAYNAGRSLEPPAMLDALVQHLPKSARVLDLGCGGGIPVARTLAQSCDVVGVDISRAQLTMARTRVPGVSWLLRDMTTCSFAPGSFDAVVSFYAILHLPRETHRDLFERVHGWLRPGGWFVASLAWNDEAPYTEPFFGVEMYWSNFGIADYARLATECGFRAINQTTISPGVTAPGNERPHPVLIMQR